MSQQDILKMIDRVTEPGVMTKAEALEFLEVLGEGIETRMECLKEEMANDGDLTKLPKLRTSGPRGQAGTASTKVTTRFKTGKKK